MALEYDILNKEFIMHRLQFLVFRVAVLAAVVVEFLLTKNITIGNDCNPVHTGFIAGSRKPLQLLVAFVGIGKCSWWRILRWAYSLAVTKLMAPAYMCSASY